MLRCDVSPLTGLFGSNFHHVHPIGLSLSMVRVSTALYVVIYLFINITFS